MFLNFIYLYKFTFFEKDITKKKKILIYHLIYTIIFGATKKKKI